MSIENKERILIIYKILYHKFKWEEKLIEGWFCACEFLLYGCGSVCVCDCMHLNEKPE